MKMNSQHIHNLTQNKDLNIIPEAVILLGENIGEKLHDIKFGDHFLDDSESTSNKRKKQINWTSPKLKTFVHQRI